MSAASQTRLLPVVIVALGAFAALKAGDVWIGFSQASAGEKEPGLLFASSPAIAEQGAVAPVTQTAPVEAAAPELPPSEVERRILEKLAARRQALDAREAELDAREAIVAAAEKQLTERAADFTQQRDTLLALREEQAATETEEIAALVSAYEKMKPRDAAAIFDELDEDILVPVSAGMRTQALAGVLAEMRPEKARLLTRLLAERNSIEKTAAAEAL